MVYLLMNLTPTLLLKIEGAKNTLFDYANLSNSRFWVSLYF
jgi:hypothetical protein